MKPERLLPLFLVMVGVVVFYLAYQKKTAQLEIPEGFEGNRAVELFYKHQCATCHTVSFLPNARGLLGPGLDNVGTRSQEYDPQGNGEEYLRESLLYPAKVVREGFVNGMPSYQGKLSEEDLDILVTWLQSLRAEGETDIVEEDGEST